MNCFVNNILPEVKASGNYRKSLTKTNRLSLFMNNNIDLNDNNKRRDFLKLPAAFFSLSIANKSASAEKSTSWKNVTLPVDTVLFDLDFVKDDPKHGWLVGSKGTFLETLDGGETWVPRTFANLDPDEELTYRFENVSFFWKRWMGNWKTCYYVTH